MSLCQSCKVHLHTLLVIQAGCNLYSETQVRGESREKRDMKSKEFADEILIFSSEVKIWWSLSVTECHPCSQVGNPRWGLRSTDEQSVTCSFSSYRAKVRCPWSWFQGPGFMRNGSYFASHSFSLLMLFSWVLAKIKVLHAYSYT